MYSYVCVFMYIHRYVHVCVYTYEIYKYILKYINTYSLVIAQNKCQVLCHFLSPN